MPALEVDDAFRSITAFADSTVQFFRRRADLEQSYLEGLEKILAKQEESDRKAEALFGESSLLAAWSEVKATAYAELAERKQLVLALQKGVVEPLIHFRDQKDRQRRRIKEELSNTASEHGDYKSHTLRLKRVYQRKSEEVRSLSAVPEAAASQPSTSGTTSGTSGAVTGANAIAGTSAAAAAGAIGAGIAGQAGSSVAGGASGSSSSSAARENRPRSSSPGGQSGYGTPLTPHASSSSGHDVLISGATSTVLRDAHSPPPVNNAAIHAIKSSRSQLNNLINRLGSAGRASENIKPSILQTKLSKAKREAEESDASYRSALHHLETLRMQRERVSKASLGSLHEFCYELSSTCKSIFAQYCDSWAGKARQTEMVCERAKNATYAISPEQDVSSFNRAAKVNIFFEEPLPYENYHVGVSYSLIFGVSLSEYSASNDGVLVPLTVQRAILEIDSRGLDVEGIYRIPGKLGLIQQVVQAIEQDEFAFEFDPERHDVHTVAGVLKLYLRQLPDALIPIDSKERELISSSPDSEAHKVLSKKLRKLPPSHQATAKMLIAHFARVLNHSASNKMSTQALALCLNPVIFPEETSISAFAQGTKDRCLEYLIVHRQELFNGLPILDHINSPYRNARSAESSGVLDDDDDDDIPFRRSQESVKLPSNANSPTRPSLLGPSGTGLVLDTKSLAFPPRSSSYRTPSSEEPTPVVHTAPSLPSLRERSADSGSSTTVAGRASAPMSITASRSSDISTASNAASEPLQASPRMNQGAQLQAVPTYSRPGTSTTTDIAPKRSLSQRAKMGGASIANAVKGIGRSRSGSTSQNNYHGQQYTSQTPPPQMPVLRSPTPSASARTPTQPVQLSDSQSLGNDARSPDPRSRSSSGDSSLPVPPLQASTHLNPPIALTSHTSVHTPPASSHLGDSLPAGAAPLLGRPPSFAASSPPSNLPTPDLPLRGQIENPLVAEPHILSGLQSYDPGSIYENYHTSASSNNLKNKRASSE